MRLHILDASVAIKWYAADESGRGEALELLEDFKNRPKAYAVPELFFNEMLAVLVRLQPSDQAAVHQQLEDLQDLGIQRVGNGRQLLAEACTLATEHKITGYDATYAATARLTKGLWLTADSKAHERIKALKISKLVCQG